MRIVYLVWRATRSKCFSLTAQTAPNPKAVFSVEPTTQALRLEISISAHIALQQRIKNFLPAAANRGNNRPEAPARKPPDAIREVDVKLNAPRINTTSLRNSARRMMSAAIRPGRKIRNMGIVNDDIEYPTPRGSPAHVADSTVEFELSAAKRLGQRARAKKQRYDDVVGDDYEELTMQTINKGNSGVFRPKRLKLNLLPPSPDEEYREPSPGIITSLYECLQAASKTTIQTELPRNPDPDDDESRWTAKQLTDLYLYCYAHKAFNICDLITDSWIRAFHNENMREDQAHVPNMKRRPWKPSPNVRQNSRGDPLPHHYQVQRARMDKSVTSIYQNIKYKEQLEISDGSETLLDCVNKIYLNTSGNCPARLLWADMLALHGQKLEDLINPPRRWPDNPLEVVSGSRTPHTMHPDLTFDILCTTLRMARRNLTLKCEESCVGAWCDRYHIHQQYGLKCYRQLAEEQEDAREEAVEDAELAVPRQDNRHVSFVDHVVVVDDDDAASSSEED